MYRLNAQLRPNVSPMKAATRRHCTVCGPARTTLSPTVMPAMVSLPKEKSIKDALSQAALQVVQYALQSGGQRTGQLDPLPRPWVPEGEPGSVQKLPVERKARPAVPVYRVANDRVSDVSEMHAYLVCAARVRLHLEIGIAVELLQETVFCYCLAPLTHDRDLLALADVATQRGRDETVHSGHPALHESQIHFLDFALSERFLQRLPRGFVLGEQDQTRMCLCPAGELCLAGPAVRRLPGSARARGER